MFGVRNPAVAGTFYPIEKEALKRLIASFLAESTPCTTLPKAIIAPHAGYIYSGPVAASAYKTLEHAAGTIKKVLLLGPSHHVYFEGLALPTDTSFKTPLGHIPIDKTAIALLRNLPFVHILNEAHRQEHSIETHLPFLQWLLKDFSLIPLVVGDAPPEHIAEVIERLWGGPETLIVISSDLSHYHNYATAQAIDRTTSDAILQHDMEKIIPETACGCRAVNGLLTTAKKLGLTGQLLDLRNSGDTAGEKTRVVGYGAYHFGVLHNESLSLTPFQKNAYKTLAREAIAYGLVHGVPLTHFTLPPEANIAIPKASFVTLEINGQLRGCIGSLIAHLPLPLDIASNAFQAAFGDPRFPALKKEELATLDIHISVLSSPSPLSFSSEEDLISQLQPGIDGLILRDGKHQATFLPAVWEDLPDPLTFLHHLKKKAGLPTHYWSPTLTVERYTADYF